MSSYPHLARLLNLIEQELARCATPPTPTPPLPRPAGEPEYLDTRAAARLLGVSAKGLERMRARGEGPPCVRVGKRIRYRRSDLA